MGRGQHLVRHGAEGAAAPPELQGGGSFHVDVLSSVALEALTPSTGPANQASRSTKRPAWLINAPSLNSKVPHQVAWSSSLRGRRRNTLTATITSRQRRP
jgi:hypothetical protein